MAEIILDCGSGNTCKNDRRLVEEMIDAVKAVDSGKHDVVIKWQLFEDQPPNVPLRRDVFDYAYTYAAAVGYKCTSSVFDKPSLEFLLTYDVPFVKIANRPDLWGLIGEIPRNHEVYVSVSNCRPNWTDKIRHFSCVPEYPATIQQYARLAPLGLGHLSNISDHTVGLGLWYKYQPARWEKHLKLPDSTGPDAGPFAITPEELGEIL